MLVDRSHRPLRGRWLLSFKLVVHTLGMYTEKSMHYQPRDTTMQSTHTGYEDLLRDVVANGQYRPDRTGTGAYSVFGASLEYDLAEGFPLITTKKVHLKSVVGELLWFISGSTNALELEENYGVTIWREWMDEDGELGNVYGRQWRGAPWATSDGDIVEVDQLANVIQSLKVDPFGRRHIVNSWNVGQITEMALPPCHMTFQFWVGSDADGKPNGVSLHLYQRSADIFLGVPFNIASYALLLEMVAQQIDLPARHLKLTFGDAHIYANHREQVGIQLNRVVQPFPTLTLDPASNIDDYTPEHIHIAGYNPHPPISAPVAV